MGHLYYRRDRLSRVFSAEALAALRTGGGDDVTMADTLGLDLEPNGLPGLRGGVAEIAETAASAAGVAVAFVALRGPTGGGAGLTAIEHILALKLGRGCLWASGDEAAEVVAGRMMKAATVATGRPGLRSGLTSRALDSSITYPASEASRLPIHMGARGRCASCARDGRGGRMKGSTLQ